VVAKELLRHRERAGMTLAAAAQALGVHTQTIIRTERAQTMPRRATVAQLARIYGVGDEETRALLDWLDHAQQPGWWHAYRRIVPEHMDGLMDLETEAELIRIYAPAVVPELLRAPGYARQLLAMRRPRAGPGELDRHLELVRQRQQHRGGRLWVVLEEAAVCRPVGGAKVMAEQREHLARYVAEPGRDGVTVQWIPFGTAPHPLMLGGPLEIYRHPHRAVPDHLVLRGLTEQTVTDDADTVMTHVAAMDTAASRGHPPTTALPRVRSHA